MKAARLLLGLVCGAVCLALFSGCETQRSACEREKRLTERMDEMQMDLDGRIQGVNMEFAQMRANPPVIVNNVPSEPMPQMASGDTITITDYDAEYSKRAELERLAQEARAAQLAAAPAPRASASANTNRIRVPVPARTVQAALRQAGHYNGSIDGKVGKQTIAAITSFQRQEGLKADGIVGRATWGRLQGYVPAEMSVTRLK